MELDLAVLHLLLSELVFIYRVGRLLYTKNNKSLQILILSSSYAQQAVGFIIFIPGHLT